ncbi:type II secretion system minor pseudopilin GspI [Thalassotalea sp. Y01]|uniref:type II secretion system minor pseudopilin GspI n=1 Tax=Thalassotalea sp. Y01 TaxID=2729613 RepID=UPI00145ED214|nr:type II secretion system minor pseudopilin GspI [Thalassotalea sp. Y01]NMP17006.1 type II secretion system minor pseudopilin GspI [Thalassotalea sp. Y01]
MNKANGFTLIEVLLALTVFALAGTAVMNVAATSLNGTANLEVKSIATWVASNQLVEANLQQQWPPKKKNGKEEMAGHEWHWQSIIQETEDKNMRAITIEVRESEDDKYPLASLVTYVSNPKVRK